MTKVAVNPVDVGKKYDQSSSMSETFNEGQVHLGYWYGEQDETSMTEASQRMTRKVVDALGLRAGEHLLDAGCGLGAPAILIAEETGARVTGITVSGVEVAEAQKRAEASGLGDLVSFQYGDYMTLPFAEGTFDAIMAIESLQCAPDTVEALAEFLRVLRPGGAISIAEYTTEAGATPEQIRRFAEHLGVEKVPTLLEYIEAVKSVGFLVEEYTQCGPRVFGVGPKYIDSAERSRDKLAAAFGEDVVAGLKDALTEFFSLGSGYAIITARKPVS
ncbi:MAG: rebM3 [Sphaerisporangium sp.]|jgi:ubiquinone/menaquinone biosynthesis C-methylase UbiE|nr:rebM3 [Sphaerisporangium sp.]